MKNKDFTLLLGAILLTALLLFYFTSCTKIDIPAPVVIDLGRKPTSTAIKTIYESGNVVTAQFITTPGAKYSIQVLPFGSDEPVLKEGFTATDTITLKVYDLKKLTKKNYDLIFMDISGSEVKYPITIK